MLIIRGESLTGTEPAETRWRNWLMSRGVGFGGSSAVGGIGNVGVLVLIVVCRPERARSLGASCLL